MASNSSKSTSTTKSSKTKDSDESIGGYVHLLTEVQTARNSTTNYFNCHIQTGQEEAVRTVCYSPQKRMNLNQAFLNKSPVKIIGVKQTPSKRFHTREEEFTIAKHAKISPASLSFSLTKALATSYAQLLKH